MVEVQIACPERRVKTRGDLADLYAGEQGWYACCEAVLAMCAAVCLIGREVDFSLGSAGGLV